MNLREFLNEHHVKYREGGTHQHVRHGWIGLQCPWCKSYKWHLGVRLADGFTSCWRCGRHDLGQVLHTLSNAAWPSIVEVTKQLRVFQKRREGNRPASDLRLPTGVGPLSEPHRAYLKGRGFDPEYIAGTWDVKGIGLSSRLAWRLFIPITLHNKMVSWTTRSIGSGASRYLSASPNEESFPHKKVLYGADKAKNTIVVVEGPADAWAIGPGAVAVFGLEVSTVQYREISSYPTRVICFDNQPVAARRADKLASRLCKEPGDTYIVRLESGKDPADSDPQELLQIRKTYLNDLNEKP